MNQNISVHRKKTCIDSLLSALTSFINALNFFFKDNGLIYTRFNQLNESEDIKMDILETMKVRHSVRQYKN